MQGGRWGNGVERLYCKERRCKTVGLKGVLNVFATSMRVEAQAQIAATVFVDLEGYFQTGIKPVLRA